MNEQRIAYHGDAGYTTNGCSLCYGRYKVLPILLLPDNELPPDEWSTSYFNGLANSLQLNFNQLLYSNSDGYVRLGGRIARRAVYLHG